MRLFLTYLLALTLLGNMALAQQPVAVPAAPAQAPAIETAAQQMVLIDIDTDTVLAQKDADARMYPSSMTKLLTLYVIFERLKEGSVKLTDRFTVSEKAWRMQGSKMFVPIGAEVTVEDLVRGISVQSGNDACIVIAEGLAGSEEQFAKLMNDTAAKLGMTQSHFMNASGWPDENHYTTARDLAVLGERIVNDFPEYHHYASEPEFTYNNIRQYNRNLLLSRQDLGVDGLKTGHTDIAGYGIVVSAVDPGTKRRMVLVVNGLDSEKARAEEAAKLVTYGFRQFDTVSFVKAGDPVLEIPVWLGEKDSVVATVPADAKMTLPRLGREGITFKAVYDGPVAAPIKQGQDIGRLEVSVAGQAGVKSYPLVAASAVERKSAFARIPTVIMSWMGW
jgi:D-alanyl-D-alanine carboxypeptidase (penicillin-binding protein 5/6)